MGGWTETKLMLSQLKLKLNLKLELSLAIWFVLLWQLDLHVKFESFIFKIKRVIPFFYCQKFWNPEILLKFGDFWLIFCMWPLNIQSNKCYIAIWGQKWRFPWFLRGASEAPPWEPKNSIPHGPWEVGLGEIWLSILFTWEIVSIVQCRL